MANTKKAHKPTFRKTISTWQGWAENITWLFVMLYLTVFPLLLTPDKYIALTEGKYGFFVFLTLSFAALLAFRRVTALMVGEKKFGLSGRSLLEETSISQKSMAAYLIVAIISAACSQYAATVWEGAGRFDGLFTLLLYGCLFYLTSGYGKASKWYVVGTAVCMLLFSLVGILQLWDIDILTLYPEGRHYVDTNFLTTIGNIDIVATMLCMALPLMSVALVTSEDKYRWLLLVPIALGLFLQVKMNVDAGTMGLLVCMAILLPILMRNRKQIMDALMLLAVIAMVMFAAVCTGIQYGVLEDGSLSVTTSFAMGTLGKLFIAMAALCMLAWLIMRFVWKNFKLNPKVITLVLALLVVAAVAGGLVYAYNNCDGEKHDGLVYVIGQVMHGNFDDSFGSYRMLVWKRAIPMAMEHPVIGTGPDTFLMVFSGKYQADVDAAGLNVSYDFAHNDFIQIMCNYGILGLIAYVGILVGAAIGFFKNACHDRWTAILGAAVIGYYVQSFFSFSIVITAPIFFVLLGLLDARNRENRDAARLAKQSA